MENNWRIECCASTWYPRFEKDSIESRIVEIPDNVAEYLESKPFILPAEVFTEVKGHSIFDALNDEESGDDMGVGDIEDEPTFPLFSKQIRATIREFGAIFVKTNWRTPADGTWIAPTKTLKCTSLEEFYLLLKSSSRISDDLQTVRQGSADVRGLKPCVVLRKWRDIYPGSEFRCFVVNRQLLGICQRDCSQYFPYIDIDKYNIQTDITSLFNEKIRDVFRLNNYTFDVIRVKKDEVRILDFGPLSVATTKGTLFTYSELRGLIEDPPEFRFIAEDTGIQPTTNNYFCVPEEINECFMSGNSSMMQMIQREFDNQQLE